MRIWELFLIAVGLSMDAFAVSICKGLSVQRLHWKPMCCWPVPILAAFRR